MHRAHGLERFLPVVLIWAIVTGCTYAQAAPIRRTPPTDAPPTASYLPPPANEGESSAAAASPGTRDAERVPPTSIPLPEIDPPLVRRLVPIRESTRRYAISGAADSPSIEQARGRDSWHDGLDRHFDELEQGNVAFNAPRTMNLEETEGVHLTLSLSKSVEELKEMISAGGEIEGHEIQVSDRMEARLTGSNFSITAITPEVQAVGRKSVTEWKWAVTPKSKGYHNLHLTLTAILEVEGRQFQRSIRTFDRNIEIYVTWHQQAEAFFRNSWQWLWAAILLPVVGWVTKKWRHRHTGRGK